MARGLSLKQTMIRAAELEWCELGHVALFKRLRPVFRQPVERIKAPIFISFVACYLHVTLEQSNKKVATGLNSRSVPARLSEIQMLDVTIPTTDGRELRMKRHTKPEKVHHLLINQLGFIPALRPLQKSATLGCDGDLLKKTNAISTIDTPKMPGTAEVGRE